MIKPTVGRQVWFRPNGCIPGIAYRDDQPCAATIAYVWSDRMVNLQVIDMNGVAHSVTSVNLLQDDDVPGLYSCYAEWMPFQIGQAKAQEATPA